MAKTLIIGGASNYTWNDLQYWVNSIKATNFSGDITIVATNIDTETIDKLSNMNVKVSVYGDKKDGRYESTSSVAPHVERFFWIWNHLKDFGKDYEHVVVTDTRDVIFQDDPTKILEEMCSHRPLIASSEGLLYKDEPWGLQNIHQSIGPFFSKALLEDKLICNVGVIGGATTAVRDLLLMIFQMSLNRPIPIVDQAVYNFLLNVVPYTHMAFRLNNTDRWAVQLGTTKYAIEAGAGDIGYKAAQDPAVMEEYLKNYKDVQPEIKGHEVFNHLGEKYCIVHQWDRIPTLMTEVVKHYGS